VTFTHDEPPPSANKIYTVSRGRKILTSAARNWKTKFIGKRGGLTPLELGSIDLCAHDQFSLEVWVYLPVEEVYALKYGKDQRTKYPIKKVDTSNFFKLAEDAVTELLGNIACDRQNFKIIGHKSVADHRGSRIVIHLRHYEGESDPYDPSE
jgi:hypothetical protein